MTGFQQLLHKLQGRAGLPQRLAESPRDTEPQTILLAQADTRIPYAMLPNAHRYRQLTLTADQYFSAVAITPADEERTNDEKRLQELQHLLTRKLLLFQGHFNLLQIATSCDEAIVDVIQEYRVKLQEHVLKWLFLAGASAIFTAALISMLWTLISDHRTLITRS
jgi:hypothetical protein